MSHEHSHSGHPHVHAPADFGRAFLIGIVLNTGFVIVEAAMGFHSSSLALLSDAGHNLSDVLGLVLAWGAAILAKRPAAGRYTYGLKRVTILAALANAVFLLVSVGAIGLEAINRLHTPQHVAAEVVAWVSGVGIFVNGVTALLFISGSKGDLNIRGAFLHMAADAAVSLGVMLAGILILFTGWTWVDPVVSLGVLLVILLGTWNLFTESLGLALDAAPRGTEVEKVSAMIAELPGVTSVHHVHIWALSTTETALTAHVVKTDPTLDDALLGTIRKELEEHFAISHVTIQLEEAGLRGCAER
ncbi:MAG: cation diffusion facilitator family transporter [Terrimicrobiaceae bacterium]|nr:cation diffusion facilitator family transporter [Terrimicrobiaceae bacterium]